MQTEENTPRTNRPYTALNMKSSLEEQMTRQAPATSLDGPLGFSERFPVLVLRRLAEALPSESAASRNSVAHPPSRKVVNAPNRAPRKPQNRRARRCVAILIVARTPLRRRSGAPPAPL